MPDPSSPSDPIDAEIVPADPIAPVTAPAPDYDERGVPSFDHVRARIEGRHATSQGMTELTADTPQGRTVEEQITERDRKAAEKLAEIRRSLGR
jgi:phage shock protein A